MNIYFDSSHAGNGKTTRALNRLISTPTKAIYCCERNETMDEIKDRIHSFDQNVQVAIINSDNTANVKKRVENIPYEFANRQHVIVLISHVAMMSADFDIAFTFTDWEIVIDEVPSLLKIGHANTKASAALLPILYTLESAGEGWSKVGLTPFGKSVTLADVANDEFVKSMREFHQAVLRSADSRGSVLTRLVNWDRATSGEKWFFASWFSFHDLSAFDRVTVLGNEFMSSVAVCVVRHFDNQIAAKNGEELNWIPLTGSTEAQKPKPRKVTINYYSDDHATRYNFNSEIGKANLIKIAKHLATVLPVGESIWSANNSGDDANNQSVAAIMSEHLRHGYISPKQAGSNRFRHIHHSAMMYSANASHDCDAFLKLANLSASDWQRTNEHEAMLQLKTRTSIRDADSDHDVFFYVYDRHDAEYLATYFKNLGHDVRVQFCEIGLQAHVDQRKNNTGRPTLDLTAEERSARRKEQNAKNKAAERARKKAAKNAA